MFADTLKPHRDISLLIGNSYSVIAESHALQEMQHEGSSLNELRHYVSEQLLKFARAYSRRKENFIFIQITER